MEPAAKVKLARALIPVTAESTYLNTASLGPVSNVYAETLARCTASDVATGRAIAPRYRQLQAAGERVRAEVAALVRAQDRQIRLTQSTSDGLAAAINSIPWRPGDEVVTTNIEHEACTEPLEQIARRFGVTIRVATLPQAPGANLDWLHRELSERTRLVTFSAVSFMAGYRLPIMDIVQAAHANGALALLDAAQGLGAVPLDLPACGVDFCAMPLQKWLCGPEGLGALYVRDDALGIDERDRVVRGWGTLEATAKHLESLRIELGWDWILARTSALAQHARQRARKLADWTLETPEDHAGLVTIRSDRVDVVTCAVRLAHAHFVFRTRPEARSLRIATAFFNTESEIDSFFSHVQEAS
jgi:L-cysteine/cystine lyase